MPSGVYIRTEKYRKIMSKALKGNKNALGHKLSKEAKIKISLNHADFKGENNPMFGKHRYGKENPMYGKHLSEKHKKILKIALKKRWNIKLKWYQKLFLFIKKQIAKLWIFKKF